MIKEITAKSILRKQKKIDSWFITRYGMNLYRGCTHNCAYCDGRYEGYYLEGTFGCDLEVKVNAPDILRKELDPKRKRKPLKPGFFVLGGGVSDSYQPAEKTYQLARQCLELFLRYQLPVHILTKSTLVERDFDLLLNIHDVSRAILSVSLSTVNPAVSSRFEPGVPSPSLRLRMIEKVRALGIPAGVFLMPVLPGISDSEEEIASSVRSIKDAGANFIIFGGLTLKGGAQEKHFSETVREWRSDLADLYRSLYAGRNRWGNAESSYYDEINERFAQSAAKYGIAKRIPLSLFQNMLPMRDRIIVLLEHLDYLCRLHREQSGFGRAAYTLSRIPGEETLSVKFISSLEGIDAASIQIIREYLSTGSCRRYSSLL